MDRQYSSLCDKGGSLEKLKKQAHHFIVQLLFQVRFCKGQNSQSAEIKDRILLVCDCIQLDNEWSESTTYMFPQFTSQMDTRIHPVILTFFPQGCISKKTKTGRDGVYCIRKAKHTYVLSTHCSEIKHRPTFSQTNGRI